MCANILAGAFVCICFSILCDDDNCVACEAWLTQRVHYSDLVTYFLARLTLEPADQGRFLGGTYYTLYFSSAL